MRTNSLLLRIAYAVSIGALFVSAKPEPASTSTTNAAASSGVMFYSSDSTGKTGTCGTELEDNEYWVALHYASGSTESNCGKAITVTVTNGGTSVKGYVADEETCTASEDWCNANSIQVSKAMMDDLAGSGNEGSEVDVSWSI